MQQLSYDGEYPCSYTFLFYIVVICRCVFMQCQRWYYCESELMVVVTPQKMKNLPRCAPDTLMLPTLDVGGHNNIWNYIYGNTNTNIYMEIQIQI